MPTYRSTPDPNLVLRVDDNTYITSAHRWWSDYQDWLAAGNTPLPSQGSKAPLANASVVTFPDITLAQLATMPPASYKGMSYNLTNPAGNSAGSGIKSNGTSWVYITDDSPVIY